MHRSHEQSGDGHDESAGNQGAAEGRHCNSGAFGLNRYAFATRPAIRRKANGTSMSIRRRRRLSMLRDAAGGLGADVATHFDVNFSEEDIRTFQESDLPEAGFLYQAIQFVHRRGFEAYCTIIDCMAVGYAIDPTLVETIQGMWEWRLRAPDPGDDGLGQPSPPRMDAAAGDRDWGQGGLSPFSAAFEAACACLMGGIDMNQEKLYLQARCAFTSTAIYGGMSCETARKSRALL